MGGLAEIHEQSESTNVKTIRVVSEIVKSGPHELSRQHALYTWYYASSVYWLVHFLFELTYLSTRWGGVFVRI